MTIDAARRILLCLRYGIGDLVMQLPVLDTLRRHAPSAHITALGARPATDLLTRDPRVDAVASCQQFGYSHWGDPGTHERNRLFGEWIDDAGFDLVLDPSHAVMGARQTIWERSVDMLDCSSDAAREAATRGEGGIAAIKAAVEAGWGMRVPPGIEPRIHPSPEDARFAAQFIAASGERSANDGRRIVGISPVAASPLKRWPPARLAAVGDWLVADLNVRLLLFGGPEGRAVDEVLAGMRHRRAVTRVEPLPLPRTAAVLARCSIFLCNDTGLMHMAAAVGARVVAAFGPTSPAVYLPPRGVAVGAPTRAPCRDDSWLGPSQCQMTNRCRRTPTCIARVPTETVREAVRRMADPENARTVAG